MKPRDALLAPALPLTAGRGWRVFVDGLVAHTRIGIHAHEYDAPQPVVLDASLVYRAAPDERAPHALIDYERYCERIESWLAAKSHARLLETLAVELAALSFREFTAIEALTLALHKPKIRAGTQRIGVELDWTRDDYRHWETCQRASSTPGQRQHAGAIHEVHP